MKTILSENDSGLRARCLTWVFGLLLSLFGSHPALAAVLQDAAFEDNGHEAVLTLRFDSEPPIRYTPMTDSRILILDFGNALMTTRQGRMSPRSRLVEYVSLAQFNRDRLRLVLRVYAGTVVNVYRYPVPGRRDVRFAVVVERENSMDRFFNLPHGRKTRPRIVIDPGHGGHDSGALGLITSDKEIALRVARELKQLFDADRRVEAFFTRLSDHFVPLEDRTLFARKVEADAFVSIHGNAMVRDNWSRGVEVWYLSERGAAKELSRVLQDKGVGAQFGRASRSSLASSVNVDQIILSMQQSKTISQSSLLSRIINRNLVQLTGQETRGVKRSNFKVIRPIDIPSCLVEVGFLTNPAEERLMASWGYPKKAAAAIFHAVLEWMARTGRLKGQAANGLIRADVSNEESGEEERPGLEEEANGDHVGLVGGAVSGRTSSNRGPRDARRVPGPSNDIDLFDRARGRLRNLRR